MYIHFAYARLCQKKTLSRCCAGTTVIRPVSNSNEKQRNDAWSTEKQEKAVTKDLSRLLLEYFSRFFCLRCAVFVYNALTVTRPHSSGAANPKWNYSQRKAKPPWGLRRFHFLSPVRLYKHANLNGQPLAIERICKDLSDNIFCNMSTLINFTN